MIEKGECGNFPTVSVKVDSCHRLRLARLVKPGEEYEPETPKPGVIVLRKLSPQDGGFPEDVVLDTWEKLGPAPKVLYDEL